MSYLKTREKKFFINEGSIANFVKQFQSVTNDVICIFNETEIKLYKDKFPRVSFVTKKDDIYYFIDDECNRYCILTKEKAKIFCPCFDKDYSLSPLVIPLTDKIVIMDGTKMIEFERVNGFVEVIEM
jgi:hypothetical protein